MKLRFVVILTFIFVVQSCSTAKKNNKKLSCKEIFDTTFLEKVSLGRKCQLADRLAFQGMAQASCYWKKGPDQNRSQSFQIMQLLRHDRDLYHCLSKQMIKKYNDTYALYNPDDQV